MKCTCIPTNFSAITLLDLELTFMCRGEPTKAPRNIISIIFSRLSLCILNWYSFTADVRPYSVLLSSSASGWIEGCFPHLYGIENELWRPRFAHCCAYVVKERAKVNFQQCFVFSMRLRWGMWKTGKKRFHHE